MDLITHLCNLIIQLMDIVKIKSVTSFFIKLKSLMPSDISFKDAFIFKDFSLNTLLFILCFIIILNIIYFSLKKFKKDWKILLPSLIITITFVKKTFLSFNVDLESINPVFISNIYTVLILYLLIYLLILSITFQKKGYLSNLVQKILTLSILKICSIPIWEIIHVHINKDIIVEFFFKESFVLLGIISGLIMIISSIIEDIPIKEFLVKNFNNVINWIYDLFNNIINYIINLNLLYVKVPFFKVYIPDFDLKPYTPEILYNSLTVFIKYVVYLISKCSCIHMYLDNIDVEKLNSKCIETGKSLISTTLSMNNPNAGGFFINYNPDSFLEVNEPESNENEPESNGNELELIQNDDWQEPEHYFLVDLYHNLFVKEEVLRPLPSNTPSIYNLPGLNTMDDLYNIIPNNTRRIEIYVKPEWFIQMQSNTNLLKPHPDYLNLNNDRGPSSRSVMLRKLIVDEDTGCFTNYAKDTYCGHWRESVYKERYYRPLNDSPNAPLDRRAFKSVSNNISKYLQERHWTGVSYVRLIHGIIHCQFVYGLSGRSPEVVEQRLSDILPSINSIHNELQKFEYKVTMHKASEGEVDVSTEEVKILFLENKGAKDGIRLLREVEYMRDFAYFATSKILKHLPEERKIAWGTSRRLARIE